MTENWSPLGAAEGLACCVASLTWSLTRPPGPQAQPDQILHRIETLATRGVPAERRSYVLRLSPASWQNPHLSWQILNSLKGFTTKSLRFSKTSSFPRTGGESHSAIPGPEALAPPGSGHLLPYRPPSCLLCGTALDGLPEHPGLQRCPGKGELSATLHRS